MYNCCHIVQIWRHVLTVKLIYNVDKIWNADLSGHVAQSVTSPVGKPGAVSAIPARPGIDYEILSMVILLVPLIQEVLLSITIESMCR